MFELYSVRNVPQDLSAYQRRVKSGRAERGSNWLLAQPARQQMAAGSASAAAIGC